MFGYMNLNGMKIIEDKFVPIAQTLQFIANMIIAFDISNN
jgi:hypothetical protein